jgi:hypothetical protein
MGRACQLVMPTAVPRAASNGSEQQNRIYLPVYHALLRRERIQLCEALLQLRHVGRFRQRHFRYQQHLSDAHHIGSPRCARSSMSC